MIWNLAQRAWAAEKKWKIEERYEEKKAKLDPGRKKVEQMVTKL